MTLLTNDMTGEEFKTWRKEQFLSQQDVATLLGVARLSVINWEKNRTPVPLRTILALETITAQRASLVRHLRQRQEQIAYRRRMKAIQQDIKVRREAFQAGVAAGKAEAQAQRPARGKRA